MKKCSHPEDFRNAIETNFVDNEHIIVDVECEKCGRLGSETFKRIAVEWKK